MHDTVWKTATFVFAMVICSTVFTSGCNDSNSSGGNTVEPLSVVNIAVILDSDRTLDWSHDNGLIAFSMLENDGYYDVAVMNSDGTDITCLSCDSPDLPNRHISNPTWHPSGDYIVMQVEKQDHFGPSSFSTPGVGFNCDLWAMTADGSQYYQLTDLVTKLNTADPNPTTGVLHPHFSHDGSKLVWGQLLEGGTGDMGKWELKTADFVVEANEVYLQNEKTHTPGDQQEWYESHGFSVDGTQIIFSGSLQAGQAAEEMDIYTYTLSDGELTQLTNTLMEWDEHAHYSPGGTKIVWMCSVNDFDPADWRGTMRSEYFIMDADGSNKQQLTFFNTPGHPHHDIYAGAQVIVADNSWNAEGDKIMSSLVADGQPNIVEIELNQPADSE